MMEIERLSLDQVQEIFTHPDNIEILRKKVEEKTLEVADHVFTRPIKITGNAYLERSRPKLDSNGKQIWKRGKVLPDTNLITWVEDIQNPTSWAIYFGLVEPEEELVFYGLTKRSAVKSWK
jgi:hypothetical protein